MDDRAKDIAETAQPPTQADQALAFLRDRIIDLTLEPGLRIDERLLVDKFGLGRTPGREALNRLASEGFVVFRPNRGGAVVRSLDISEFEQLIEAHQFIEAVLGHRCRLATLGLVDKLRDIQSRYVPAVTERDFLRITHLNTEFHMAMHATLQNQLLHDFALSVHRRVERMLNYTYRHELLDKTRQDEQFRLNLIQHDELIESIEKGARTDFATRLLEHGKHVEYRLVNLLQRRGLNADEAVF
ncbi:GntR family transcriptional regulator [Puniceibacterium antarcticum]|nr:GntR family transcriptional regulator [Puniceibacterium antarcticum]